MGKDVGESINGGVLTENPWSLHRKNAETPSQRTKGDRWNAWKSLNISGTFHFSHIFQAMNPLSHRTAWGGYQVDFSLWYLPQVGSRWPEDAHKKTSIFHGWTYRSLFKSFHKSKHMCIYIYIIINHYWYWHEVWNQFLVEICGTRECLLDWLSIFELPALIRQTESIATRNYSTSNDGCPTSSILQNWLFSMGTPMVWDPILELHARSGDLCM